LPPETILVANTRWTSQKRAKRPPDQMTKIEQTRTGLVAFENGSYIRYVDRGIAEEG
jgi:hypothetical protein